jgi:hypothetical protein
MQQAAVSAVRPAPFWLDSACNLDSILGGKDTPIFKSRIDKNNINESAKKRLMIRDQRMQWQNELNFGTRNKF